MIKKTYRLIPKLIEIIKEPEKNKNQRSQERRQQGTDGNTTGYSGTKKKEAHNYLSTGRVNVGTMDLGEQGERAEGRLIGEREREKVA